MNFLDAAKLSLLERARVHGGEGSEDGGRF